MPMEAARSRRPLFLLFIWLICSLPAYSWSKVIWAVNCGGGEHVDLDGIRYAADNLDEGIASDYGRSFTINRVPHEDQIIYQTERYNTGDLTYEIPVSEPGDYVLTLKFAEVWFTRPMQKMFGIRLAEEIDVIVGLDIFLEVGFATALNYDIPIRIADGRLHFGHQSSVMSTNHLKVTFVKTDHDNPKVNAIVLTEGDVSETLDNAEKNYCLSHLSYHKIDVSMLPPLEAPSIVESPEMPKDETTQDIKHRPAAIPKMFGIRLAEEIDVIVGLDIFREVGFATALNYDIPIRIADGRLHFGHQSSVMSTNHLKVTFVKTDHDNPKVNAIVLTEGDVSDVSMLPPLEAPSIVESPEMPKDETTQDIKHRPAAIPKVTDPYTSTNYPYLLIPTLITVTAILPIVFYLCRV